MVLHLFVSQSSLTSVGIALFPCARAKAVFAIVAESAVGAAGREPAEAQRQRAGAEGVEEGNGGDEGEMEERSFSSPKLPWTPVGYMSPDPLSSSSSPYTAALSGPGAAGRREGAAGATALSGAAAGAGGGATGPGQR